MSSELFLAPALFLVLQLLCLEPRGAAGGVAAPGGDAGVHPDSNFESSGQNFKKIGQETRKLAELLPM